MKMDSIKDNNLTKQENNERQNENACLYIICITDTELEREINIIFGLLFMHCFAYLLVYFKADTERISKGMEIECKIGDRNDV